MATTTFTASINAGGNASAVAGADKVAAMSKTAVVAAVAVLTADAASPTQGHVVTAQAALDAFVVQTDAARAVVSSNVELTVDKASIDTMDKLRKVLRAIEFAASQTGEFTP